MGKDALKNMIISRDRYNIKKFVVCPRFQFWVASLFMSLLWISLCMDRSIFPCGDLVADVLIFLVCFVGAPLGVFLALWKLQIEGEYFYVSKFFGFIRRKYSFQELKNAEISIRKEGTKYEAIKIKFHDGVKLKIDPFCSGYKRFKEIITHLGLV